MWYQAWGRYSWNCHRGEDKSFWKKTLAEYYGTDTITAGRIIDAYDDSGEIAPKLLRRFGITEGNRQCLLLGMKISQLVNPYKYTIYPGFYESCGPTGEKLIEYVEKEWKHEKHIGELPLDIVDQCVEHGNKAVADIEGLSTNITKNKDEFERLLNDMRCYRDFALSFRYKVLAAEQVLNYKWSKDVEYLKKAVPLLEKSNNCYKDLVEKTKDTYYNANSMLTSQRRIPVGGDGGKYSTWQEMMPVYQEELDNLKKNISALTSADNASARKEIPAKAADALIYKGNEKKGCVKLMGEFQTVTLKKGVKLFVGRDEAVDTLATELEGMKALVLNRDTARIKGISVEFECSKPVKLLVGFFVDDQTKFARPPKLETDATGNEYGQAEPVISNGLILTKMPIANIHAYHFSAGHHVINLPKGIIMVAGFTGSELKIRDAKLNGAGTEVDWLFM